MKNTQNESKDGMRKIEANVLVSALLNASIDLWRSLVSISKVCLIYVGLRLYYSQVGMNVFIFSVVTPIIVLFFYDLFKYIDIVSFIDDDDNDDDGDDGSDESNHFNDRFNDKF